jgi:alkylation response protein AidB-like acyl-CoA dehydrogenase
MDFDLSEQQQVVNDLAAQIFEGQATTERVKAAEAADGFDRALWSALAGAGLLGLCLPERDGGADMGMVELALIAEQQGRRVAPVPVVPTLVTAMTVARHGSDELRAELLPGVIDGSIILTSALAEVGANEVASPTTLATATADGYHLAGCRPAVPYGQHAKRIVVPARLENGESALFAIDPAAAGVTVEVAATTDRQPAAHITLDTGVPAAARFGHGESLVELYRQFMVGLCAVHLGVAEGSLALTADHVRTRHQFGKPLSAFQAVGQRAADAYITTEALRVTTMNAAWRLAEGLPAGRDVLVAAYWASEGGQQVALTGQHLHGGIGADVDYPVHRYFQWSSQLANTLGTASSHLARLGELIANDTSNNTGNDTGVA